MEQRPMDPAITKLVRDAERAGDEARSKRARPFLARDYFKELDEWARKVRRDILVIEYHLKKLGVTKADIFGDPGDPPPPPDELA